MSAANNLPPPVASRTFNRSAHYFPNGDHRRHPLYTLNDLASDLNEHANDHLHFNLWDGSRCCEVTPELAMDLAQERLHLNFAKVCPSKSPSPVIVTSPRHGYVIST
jgi:hypothetical protein